ncbi:MAG: xanthan lyase, partial [Ignavibacteriaceae bacterium]
EPGKIISADAVRFGGGMGIVERGGSTSGRPKFVEGARYWLQYAGMPDTLIYDLNKNKNDYNDDYQSRAEYGNYLNGAPSGPNKDRNAGLGIPIDLSLAFHTDAGITKNDTTVGTLSIYSIEDSKNEINFPDGISRLANRDLADIMQTQIVNDVKSKYDTTWNRRELRNAQYSESARPNVPSLLLELLSHQNFLDMQFASDPRFKFDVARAIYKGMLRFLSVQNDFKYIVQPLPITHFSIEFIDENSLKLKWKNQIDPLEPTSIANRYIVYTRINEGDFDNGKTVNDTSATIDIEPTKIYSFKVTAVNEGGESFPSEILSACRIENNKSPVLIINAFDRICGPEKINENNFKGFLYYLDAGVPDKYDINFTGTQYDFDPNSEYQSNDAPGHGASHADFETKIIAGNSFDFPFIHGKAIASAGFSFVSSSDGSVCNSEIDISKYKFIDIILGEEKETKWQNNFADSINGKQFKAFPISFQNQIKKYTDGGGNLFISGAYAGKDLFSKRDSVDINFAQKVLKFNWATDHASVTGEVESVDESIFNKSNFINFNTNLNDSIYAVESPDAVNPVKESKTILRYNENKFSAATAYKDKYGVIIFGFPFETILNETIRNDVMKSIIKYFGL